MSPIKERHAEAVTNDADPSVTILHIWDEIKRAAEDEVAQEPLLGGYLHDYILRHRSFSDSLSHNLASALIYKGVTDNAVHRLMVDVLQANPDAVEASLWDLQAISMRDPAAHGYLYPFLYYKGFRALQCWRLAHGLWKSGRKGLAYFLQSRISEVFSMDIHPAAEIGQGIFIDHGTGIVIGETSVVENDVSLLHNVTLGGTGKDVGDRHPKVRRGVLVGAGATILGNIVVGIGSKVAAGSMVLNPVPATVQWRACPPKSWVSPRRNPPH